MKAEYQDPEKIKETVKQKYAGISRNQSSCCAPAADSGSSAEKGTYSVFSDDYSGQPGYLPEADLNLGCGLPTEFANIKTGDTVVDLGSGAGNDCFIARQFTGDEGRVIGIDMTEAMVERAVANAAKLGYQNVNFLVGDIENIPLDDYTADVVVSNCVLNLVPDKKKAFAETYRILKPGGHFSISDVVTEGYLPETIRKDAEMYAGCVAGAMNKKEYLAIVEKTGFRNLTIQKLKEIQLPEDMLARYLSPEEIDSFRYSDTGVYSITLYAEKL